jgi:transcription-repair coupling factor (superfamily II helicase)
LQPQVAGLGLMTPVTVEVGREYDIGDLARRLADAAYTRTDLVTHRGEFAIRGGILDLFAPTDELPCRIDFFGDEVEAIRVFSVGDQRSTDETRPAVTATPCRELLLTDQVRARAQALVTDHPELADMLDRIAAGHAVDGMEALAPALVDGLELLTDVVPGDTLVVVCDPELVRGRAKDLVATSQEFLRASWAAAAGGGQAPIDLGASAYQSLADVRQSALSRGLGWWTLSPFGLDAPVPADGQADNHPAAIAETPANAGTTQPEPSSAVQSGPAKAPRPGSTGATPPEPTSAAQPEPTSSPQPEATGATPPGPTGTAQPGLADGFLTVAAQPAPSYRGRPDEAGADLRRWLAAGDAVVVTADGHGLATRHRDLLTEAGLPVRLLDDLDEAPPAGQITVAVGRFAHGFHLPSLKLRLATAADLTGAEAPDPADRQLPRRRRKEINPLELATGDTVVHDHHGVGRYVELTQREVGGAVRDYLVIEYAPSKRGQPGDRLYVPMDQLHLVTRYVGGEAPPLDKLGGGDWAKRKARARRAVREIAQELIQLYAARQATPGFAFSPDSEWQR